jgi:soluble lytic murein transglycosylase-like protein
MTIGKLKNWGCLLLGVVLLGTVTAGTAEVFKYEDFDGHTYLTDRPMKGPYTLVWRSGTDPRPEHGAATFNARQYQLNKVRFSPMIDAVASRNQLNPELLHAVIRAESAYDPRAVSSAGAVGLMQLMPATAKRYGVRNRRDPVSNLDGGARYLSDLMQLFEHNVKLALAAYNAGENAVVEYGNRIPPFAETQRYVSKVLTYYRENRQATSTY